MNPLVSSILGIVAMAVTARFLHLFLLGRRFRQGVRVVDFFGRALMDFAVGWRGRSLSYLFTAYPAWVLSVAVASGLFYWLSPMIRGVESQGYPAMLGQALGLVLVAVMVATLTAFILIYLVYIFRALLHGLYRRLRQRLQRTKPTEPTQASDNP
ncbi:MAG: hypothetical protein LBU79_06610 [Planctomycetota bacterium]|jgi:hypothetical protein|nr:hypothetical protein [Planctomycetota bacterium]